MTAFSLRRILSSLEEHELVTFASPDLPGAIKQIRDDSRVVEPGDLFIAVRGASADGHRFLGQAAANGAAAAIVESRPPHPIPAIVVRDTRAAAAIAAATFHRFPSHELRVLGVTGTNGKTTTVSLLRHLMVRHERLAASIGTLGILVENEQGLRAVEGGAPLTTPGAIELQRTLRTLLDQGVRSVAMEVSSHSLDQRRVDGIDFNAAIFTSLTRDHIDYHGTMGAYFAAKARLCALLAPDGVAVVNADDPQWLELPLQGKRVVRFGIEDAAADVRASEINFSSDGSRWVLHAGVERHAVHLPLLGAFNVSNALAAAAAAWSLGGSPAAIAASLSRSPQVPGRMERLHDEPVVLRDYAHTPDALERAIKAIQPFAPHGVLVVFGCGGDRDRGKRPQMGEIAARLADGIIITSDNPRSEDPEAILDDIAAGIGDREYERIEDRRAAIARAIEIASDSGAAVLLAGKGHETYQLRGNERLHFDEKEIVAEIVGAAR